MFTRCTLVDADTCCVALTFYAACADTPPEQRAQALETHDKIAAWSVRSARASQQASARASRPCQTQLSLFEAAL